MFTFLANLLYLFSCSMQGGLGSAHDSFSPQPQCTGDSDRGENVAYFSNRSCSIEHVKSNKGRYR